MPWHLQPTKFTARWFASGDNSEASFDARERPAVLAQVDLQADGRAYIHATMSRADGATPAGAWRELVRKLKCLGVRVVEWEHRGKPSAIDPARAWADTVALDVPAVP